MKTGLKLRPVRLKTLIGKISRKSTGGMVLVVQGLVVLVRLAAYIDHYRDKLMLRIRIRTLCRACRRSQIRKLGRIEMEFCICCNNSYRMAFSFISIMNIYAAAVTICRIHLSNRFVKFYTAIKTVYAGPMQMLFKTGL